MIFHRIAVAGMLIVAAFLTVGEAWAQQSGQQRSSGATSRNSPSESRSGRSAAGVERPVMGTAGASSTPGGSSMIGGASERAPRTLQAGEFVGAVQAEEGGFIGATIAEPENVRSAIDGPLIREARPQRLPGGGAAARPTEAQGMYSPRLVFAPGSVLADSFAAPPEIVRQTAAVSLMRRFRGHPGVQSVRVLNENGRITLRGVVNSEHDRQLAELLSSFEPGVWNVHNEIAVVETEQ